MTAIDFSTIYAKINGVKFLIIRFSSIGDIVLSTSLVRCLKKKFPESRIDFALKEQYAEILSGNPNISNLILYNNDFFSFIRKIRSENYDYIIDIHGNFRSFITAMFSSGRLLKVKNYLFERFMLVEFGLDFYRGNISVAERYIDAVKPLGVENDGLGPEIFINSDVKNSMNLPSGNYAGICPVSVWNTKRWPPENFIELSKKIISESGCGILIFGGPRDRGYCEKIKTAIGSGAVNLCGISIQETAYYLKMCRFLVSNDTGIMHVACALKVPVIALFGPTAGEFGFYPPPSAGKVISKDYQCKPCSTKGCNKCPVGSFSCMKDIRAGEVFSNCAAYL